MVALAPLNLPGPSPMDQPQVFEAQGERRKRVALLTGCAQRALNTNINEATIRLLTRHGCDVVIAKGIGCCGASPITWARQMTATRLRQPISGPG